MGKYTGFDFLCGQLQKVPQIEPIDLTGQTVLVVGANIGLGLESAKDFARMGPGNLAIACRSMKKAEDAAKEIREATGFDRISCYAVDLSVFASVVNFAAEFERNESRLDIFMYNAGVASILYEPTPDGWESSLQINDLSCLLLSILLLPLVMRTSEQMKTAEHRPRIVVVTSGTHYWVGPKQTQYDSPHILETLSDKEYCTQKGGMAGRYPLTKRECFLCPVLFVLDGVYCPGGRRPHNRHYTCEKLCLNYPSLRLTAAPRVLLAICGVLGRLRGLARCVDENMNLRGVRKRCACAFAIAV